MDHVLVSRDLSSGEIRALLYEHEPRARTGGFSQQTHHHHDHQTSEDVEAKCKVSPVCKVELCVSRTISHDCLRDTWMTGPPLITPRRNGCGAALEDGRLFAVGGFDGTSILSGVESYDARMKSWVSCANLLTPRSSARYYAAIRDQEPNILESSLGSVR